MKKNSVLIFFIFLSVVILIFPGSNLYCKKANSPGKSTHVLRSPTRIAFGADGNLLVTDYRLKMLLTVNRKSMEVIRWFPTNGKPLGVAYAKGHIYIGNETGGCIDVYNLAGKKRFSFKAGNQPLQRPTDLAVDTKAKKLFVAEGYEKAVKVFDLKGQLLQTIPVNAPDPDVLANPTGIAVDTVKKEIFVSDYGDTSLYVKPRIQIFNYAGELVGTISGKAGMFGTRFSRPQGLTIDRSGHVFLVECYASEILVFDRSSGSLLNTLGGYGTDPGQLRLPLDIVMDASTKNLYITNNRGANIEVFAEGGQL